MKCHFCDKSIKNYNLKFNHLKIDDSHEFDICSECATKFINWHASVLAELFPTKLMKKRFSK